MMPSPYSESNRHQALLTLDNISETIIHLEDWNKNITSTTYFDLDADLVFDAIRNDIPSLSKTIAQVIDVLSES